MEFSSAGPSSSFAFGLAGAMPVPGQDNPVRGRIIASGRLLSARLMGRRISTVDVNSPGVADSASFCFVDDPLSRQRVIDQLRRESTATVCIASLTDL